jgi:hydroxymethylpyrimidine/phosphomethylpyrimidine kinase
MTTPPRILIIAGSDSGGGAGIQGDIKTVAHLGGYAATAITALTAQNTLGVFGVHPVPPAFVADQIRVVLEDIGADAIKTGMLHSASIIDAVVESLSDATCPIVVDPVMVAKGGAALLEDDALTALITRLIPLATLLTPNLPEASLLIGKPISSVADMMRAGEALLALGAQNVLLKGGHLTGSQVTDLLITQNGCEAFSSPRIVTRHTHGTGCTLASALATCLGWGIPLEHAVTASRNYVREAIAHAPAFGAGNGPLMHNYKEI